MGKHIQLRYMIQARFHVYLGSFNIKEYLLIANFFREVVIT